MKETITLKWEKTSFSQMNELKNTYLYMFTRAKNIIYIGKTGIRSKQSVQDEIRSKKESTLNSNVNGVSVWLAYLQVNNRYKNPIQRFSEQIVHDVENLLIYAAKPSQNVQCVDNYNGRDLCIVNSDCPLLKEKINSPKK